LDVSSLHFTQKEFTNLHFFNTLNINAKVTRSSTNGNIVVDKGLIAIDQSTITVLNTVIFSNHNSVSDIEVSNPFVDENFLDLKLSTG